MSVLLRESLSASDAHGTISVSANHRRHRIPPCRCPAPQNTTEKISRPLFPSRNTRRNDPLQLGLLRLPPSYWWHRRRRVSQLLISQRDCCRMWLKVILAADFCCKSISGVPSIPFLDSVFKKWFTPVSLPIAFFRRVSPQSTRLLDKCHVKIQ